MNKNKMYNQNDFFYIFSTLGGWRVDDDEDKFNIFLYSLHVILSCCGGGFVLR